jgi:hypothetical protein
MMSLSRYEFPYRYDKKRPLLAERSRVLADLPLCADLECVGHTQQGPFTRFKKHVPHKHFIPWSGDVQDDPVVLF